MKFNWLRGTCNLSPLGPPAPSGFIKFQRDDGSSLFGFPDRRERDLFRVLISVNGVGPQVGLALLESCSAAELIEAIIDGDLRRLTQAQGVGKRTAGTPCCGASRSAEWLECRARKVIVPTSPWWTGVISNHCQIEPDPLQDLQLTLNTLGYEDLEIRRAMRRSRHRARGPGIG